MQSRHHVTENTVSTSLYCNKCKKRTQHACSGKKIGHCLECVQLGPSLPSADALEVSYEFQERISIKIESGISEEEAISQTREEFRKRAQKDAITNAKGPQPSLF